MSQSNTANNTDAYGNSIGYSYADSNVYDYAHRYRDGHSERHGDSYSEIYTVAADSADSGATTVKQLYLVMVAMSLKDLRAFPRMLAR